MLVLIEVWHNAEHNSPPALFQYYVHCHCAMPSASYQQPAVALYYQRLHYRNISITGLAEGQAGRYP